MSNCRNAISQGSSRAVGTKVLAVIVSLLMGRIHSSSGPITSSSCRRRPVSVRRHQQYREGDFDPPSGERWVLIGGGGEPVREIHRDPREAFKYTARGNLVAVVTTGTAVLGLGNGGALAGKPVM